MPYQCRQQPNGEWQLQVKGDDGKWSKVANHKTQKACRAQMKAIGASKHKVTNKVELRFNGYIGHFENSAEDLEFSLASVGSQETLDIYINSEGGSYIQAMKLYDRLRRHKGSKRYYISPIAASAAAVLALDPNGKVYIPENGLMRHHMPMLSGDEPKNSSELKEAADQLENIESTLVKMVAAKTDMDEKRAIDFLNEDKWLTAQQAKDLGFVDEITPLTRQKTNISNLVLPEQIVAHVKSLNERTVTMDLKELCGELKLDVTDDMTEEQLTNSIVNHVGSLSSKIAELKKSSKKLEEKKVDEKPSFSDGIINMLVRTRSMDIDNLVGEGKITPAVATELKKEFASKDEIVNCVDIEGHSIDGFERVIAALGKNEKVINYGDSSKSKLPKQGDGETNPLIADAERRAKEARQ